MPVHRRCHGRLLPCGILVFAMLIAMLPTVGNAETWPPGFPLAPLTVSLELVARGIPDPIAVTNAGDGSGRLFVNEQVGRIRIIRDSDVLPEPFLDLRDLVRADEPEQGLLGLAFHPSYSTNGLFYVAFTGRDDTNTIMRFRVSADDPARGAQHNAPPRYPGRCVMMDRMDEGQTGCTGVAARPRDIA